VGEEVKPVLLNVYRVPASGNYGMYTVNLDLSYFLGYDYYTVNIYGHKYPKPEPLLPRLRVFRMRKVVRSEGSD